MSGVRHSSGSSPIGSLRNRAAIVGVGESDIGKVPHLSGLGLTAQAAKTALDDAGLAVRDIDGLLTAYSLTEPFFMWGRSSVSISGSSPVSAALWLPEAQLRPSCSGMRRPLS